MPLAQKFPTSVLLQEQCDEYKLPCVYLGKRKHPRLYSFYRFAPCVHWKTGTSCTRLMATGTSGKEEEPPSNSEQLALQTGTNPSSSSNMESAAMETEKSMDVEPSSGKALSGSIQETMLDSESQIYANDLHVSQSHSSTNFSLHEQITIRSIRLHERRSKKRRVIKIKEAVVHEMLRSGREGNKRKMKQRIDRDGTLKSLLSRHNTRLTAEEELELIARIQNYWKLEKVKNRLKSAFGRRPTLVEWSEEVGISCRALHSQVRSGIRSRDRLIHANLWLMASVAKQYLYCGLSHIDLFMAGFSGLIRSIEKFDPARGCRLSTYAFMWIKQAIYKNAVVKSYKSIKLSVQMHQLLDKVSRVRRLCIREGKDFPTKEEIAERMDITVDRLEKLLILEMRRNPYREWNMNYTYFLDGIVNPEDEDRWVVFEREQFMLHVRNLMVSLLTPKERKVVRLRYGFEDGRRNPLSEISVKLGMSRERARQLEKSALQRMRQRLESEGARETYSFLAHTTTTL